MDFEKAIGGDDMRVGYARISTDEPPEPRDGSGSSIVASDT
jgi:hypothetical protein